MKKIRLAGFYMCVGAASALIVLMFNAPQTPESRAASDEMWCSFYQMIDAVTGNPRSLPPTTPTVRRLACHAP